VFNLQDDSTTESEDSDFWDSDESASNASWHRRRPSSRGRSVSSAWETENEKKKRMSLLTGQYFDVPKHDHGAFDLKSGAKRRFFQSAVPSGWEGTGGVDDAVASRMGIINGKYREVDLSVLMELGARDVYTVDKDDGDEDLTMAVET